jgi:hypothetical protein
MSIKDQLQLLRALLFNQTGQQPGGWWRKNPPDPLSLWQCLEILPQDHRQTISSLIEQLGHLDTAQQCPILAITGMLNAGKSSLLAGFLSQEGRRRVLIGLANDQGTHRFILWMPQSWKEHASTWQLVLAQLQQVFQEGVEWLSTVVEEANQQYNGHSLEHLRIKLPASGSHQNEPARQRSSSLRIPLIALDPNLDNWGLALLDCPDIQTGSLSPNLDLSYPTANPSDSRAGPTPDRLAPDRLAPDRLATARTYAERSMELARQRAEVLSEAFRLSSAFLMVVPSNGLHDQFVRDLVHQMKRRMPTLDRILVVNRVPRRYLASEIGAEVASCFDAEEFHRAYMAYHFDGPLERQRLPAPPLGMHYTADDPLPVFFQVLPGKPRQPPDPLLPSDYLLDLGKQLDAGRLMSDCRSSLARQLANRLGESLQELEKKSSTNADRLQRVYRVLADAVLDFSLDHSTGSGGKLRLHASREIVQQISKSLERTAPWWAKPSRYVVWLADATKKQVSRATSSIAPLGWLGTKSRDMVDYVQGKFRRGEVGKVVDSNLLVEILRRHDFRQDLAESEGRSLQLETRCQVAIDRFQEESQTRLDDQELDRYTREIWNRMGWKQRLWTGVLPASIVFAPLVAVMALPFDFGGTGILFLASVKELLFAVGAGAGVALLSKDNMPQVAEDESAFQQLGDLFAIACDEMGLQRPRELPTFWMVGQRKTLRPSQVPERSSTIKPVVELPLDVNPEFRSRLDEILEPLLAMDGT